jgi:hypothetical protein
MASIDSGNSTPGTANVDAGYNINVTLPSNPSYIGGCIPYSQQDLGSISGVPLLTGFKTTTSGTTVTDSLIILDEHVFKEGAQYTGKHAYSQLTQTAAWSASGLLLNSASSVAASSACNIKTYAVFPIGIEGDTIFSTVFSILSPSVILNNSFEAGGELEGATSPYAPQMGFYFRIDASGIQGIALVGVTEISTGVFLSSSAVGAPVLVPTTNRAYRADVKINLGTAYYYLDGILYGKIQLTAGNSAISSLPGLKWVTRLWTGAVAPVSALQVRILGYGVYSQGSNLTKLPPNILLSYIGGSHQGSQGQTQGSATNITNSVAPVATLPSNTALSAGLLSTLGGYCAEIATTAINTDGIILAYQNPTLSTLGGTGKRIIITSITVASHILTSLVSSANTSLWTIAFGHTLVSLASTESGSAKAPRRIGLGLQSMPANAAAGALLETIRIDFNDCPIIIDPGCFISITRRSLISAPTSGNVGHMITLNYVRV